MNLAFQDLEKHPSHHELQGHIHQVQAARTWYATANVVWFNNTFTIPTKQSTQQRQRSHLVATETARWCDQLIRWLSTFTGRCQNIGTEFCAWRALASQPLKAFRCSCLFSRWLTEKTRVDRIWGSSPYIKKRCWDNGITNHGCVFSPVLFCYASAIGVRSRDVSQLWPLALTLTSSIRIRIDRTKPSSVQDSFAQLLLANSYQTITVPMKSTVQMDRGFWICWQSQRWLMTHCFNGQNHKQSISRQQIADHGPYLD